MVEIMATFENGRKVVYTMNIYYLLKNDPAVIEIMDNQTGEIIYSK